MTELKIKEDVKLLTKLTKIACLSGISLDAIQDRMIGHGVNKDIVDIVVTNNKDVKSELNMNIPESREVISCAQVLVDTLLAQDENKLDADDRRALREMISWKEGKTE